MKEELNTKCCVCNTSRPFRVVLRLSGSHVALRCKACGIIRIFARTNRQEISTDQSFRQRIQDEARFYWFAKDGYLFLVRNIGCSPRSLLDIGCSIGTTVDFYTQQGWLAKGVDIDKGAVEYGIGLGRNLMFGTVESVDDEFDVILISHLFEHLLDPGKFLKQCSQRLTPDGHLFLITPTFRSFRGWLYRENWNGFCPGEHQWIYSKKSMKLLLNRHNFTALKICQRHHRGWPALGWWRERFWWKRLPLIGLVRFAGLIGAGDGLHVLAKPNQSGTVKEAGEQYGCF